MTDFKGGFSLFPTKEKRTDKSPDYTGTIELELDQAMAMAEWLTGQPGEQSYGGKTVVKLRLSGWDATSRNGLEYFRGVVSNPQPQAPAPADECPPF